MLKEQQIMLKKQQKSSPARQNFYSEGSISSLPHMGCFLFFYCPLM